MLDADRERERHKEQKRITMKYHLEIDMAEGDE